MRPIDADRLRSVLKNIQEHTEAAIVVEATSLSVFFDYMVEVVDNQPTIAPPRNDPLTPDELQEMDGEPVWINRKEKKCKWTLVRFSNQYGLITQSCGILAWEDYGKTWMAYRRKPEEAPPC